MREKTKILFCLHPTGHDCANNGYRYMIILLQMLSHFLQLDDTTVCSFLLLKMKRSKQLKEAEIQ